MQSKWTREAIIRDLLERETKGLPMSVGGEGVDTSMYSAARRIFGSWRNTIQAAGIAPQQVLTWERWSPARILVMIRHLSRRKRPLTTLQMERRYGNLVSAARRHFGSWSKAVIAAGVKPTTLLRVVPWNQERIIEAILTRALRNETLVARLVEPRSLVEASQRLYGSWAAAVTAAGLDPSSIVLSSRRNEQLLMKKSSSSRGKPKNRTPRPPWSKVRVIEALHFRLREQRPMNSNAIARDDAALYDAMRRYLKNWEEAMRAADLDPAVYRRGPAIRPGSSKFSRNELEASQSPANPQLRPIGPA